MQASSEVQQTAFRCVQSDGGPVGMSVQTAAEEGGDIGRILRDGNTFNGAVFGAVDDQVRANRPEQHRISGEVLAFMAYTRCACEGFERIKQLSGPAVGRVDVVGGDVFPYFIEVEIGIDAENIPRHGFGFRRSRDFRWSFARDSAGSTFSPRSSEANRRPSSRLNSASWLARAWSCSSRSRRASLTTSLAEL